MIKANFKAYANYFTDTLYQWDINRNLVISGLNISTAPEIHFSNANMDRAIVRPATLVDNVVTVQIPNSILQSPLLINAHVGIYEGDTFKVIEKIEIPVISRPRPLDYKLENTDEELYSFSKLENQIANLQATVDNQIVQAGVYGAGLMPDDIIDCKIGFENEFSNIPVVVANATGLNDPFTVSIAIKEVTTTSVTLSVKNTSSEMQSIDLSWIAVGKK